MGDGEVVEIPVPGAGIGGALTLATLWGFAIAAAFSETLPWLPAWSTVALLAAAPLVGMGAAWMLLDGPLVVASPDGVRVTRRLVGLWDTFVPRHELAMVLLAREVGERAVHDRRWDDDTPPLRLSFGRREQRESWSVVARTVTNREIVLASGLSHAESAKRLADRIRRATGC